jgi:ABC-type cobalamin/Fe3+-siderophores transport system ATPase subunit
MDEPLLQCSGLRVGYAPARRGEASADGLFGGLDFSLAPGELVALMGENGCGKSTLLKTFAGLLSPLAGSVNLCGSPVAAWDARARAQKVALVRMSGSVPERMTVRDFVSMGRSPYSGLFDGRSAEDEKAIERAMDLTDVNRFANRQVSELSDGERSRVYLAEAVAQQVKVLLLDEPNAFLDIPRSHALFRMLRDLAENRNMGIVVSTHSVEYAERYCKRIMVIDKGAIRVAAAAEARSSGLLDWTEA